MALNQKIDRHTPKSRGAGSYRAKVKRATVRAARRLGRRIAAGDETAEGCPVTHGWAD